MTPRTNPFTREDLLAHAKRVHAGHESIASICPTGADIALSSRREADAMAAIVAVLENYPLANSAAECVRIICDDLQTRGGFHEVIEKMGPVQWNYLREFLTKKLANTVVYTPAPAAKDADAMEMDFA